MMISSWIEPILDFNHFFLKLSWNYSKMTDPKYGFPKSLKNGLKKYCKSYCQQAGFKNSFILTNFPIFPFWKWILPNDWNVFESCTCILCEFTMEFVEFYEFSHSIRFSPMIFPILITFTYRYLYFMGNPDKSHFHLFI